jgi:hypothetical protein
MVSYSEVQEQLLKMKNYYEDSIKTTNMNSIKITNMNPKDENDKSFRKGRFFTELFQYIPLPRPCGGA